MGSDTADGAAVYKLTDDIALVLTIGFFTPKRRSVRSSRGESGAIVAH